MSATLVMGASAICSEPPSDFSMIGTMHLLACMILLASSTGIVAADFTVLDPTEVPAIGVLVKIVPLGAAEKLAMLLEDDTGVRVMGLLDTVETGVVVARMVCLGGVV